MRCIDSHFHTKEMEEKGINVDEYLRETFPATLQCGIDIVSEMLDWEKRRSRAEQNQGLYLAAGYGPFSSSDLDLSPGTDGSLNNFQTDQLKRVAIEPCMVGIGEIGLDFYHDYGTRGRQINLFTSQMELAAQLDLPVIIHNREADREIISALQGRAVRGVMHCFSSEWAFASRILDLGFYISFAGNLTYNKSDALRQVASQIPLERILLETDAPYLAPQELRGSVNVPHNVACLYHYFSQLRGLDTDVLAEIIAKNFDRLFLATD